MTKTENTNKMIDVVNNLAEKARNVTAEAEKLAEQLRMARGTRDLPRAKRPTFVGDDGPTPELMDAVRALIMERPLLLQDLVMATGARPDRIKGVLMRFQKDEGTPLVNLGTENRALWFIPDAGVLERLKKLK